MLAHIQTFAAITLVGLCAGTVGTGIGGALVAFGVKPVKRSLSLLMGFAGGIMLSVVCFDLVPEAIEKSSLGLAVIGLGLGLGGMGLLDLLVPHIHLVKSMKGSSRYIKTGILIGIGIAIHNFPEGLAIGAGYASARGVGLGISLTIAIHDLPEGMAMAAPLLAGRLEPGKVIGSAMLAGIPTGMGALAGAVIGSVSPLVLAIALGAAGGAMLYVSCDDLIPDARDLSVKGSGMAGVALGLLIGLVLANVM